jgi:hypothetical protein
MRALISSENYLDLAISKLAELMSEKVEKSETIVRKKMKAL